MRISLAVISAELLACLLLSLASPVAYAGVSFLAPVKTATGDQPRLRVATDLSGDGKVDFAATDLASASVSVLLNQDNGTFSSTQYTVGANPADVIACDVNGDGKPDLVTADKAANQLSVLFNNGNGTFAAAVAIPTDAGPVQSRCLFFASSGNPTIHFLQVINQTAGTLQQFIDNGAGSFTLHRSTSIGSLPNYFVLSDANADGLADTVVANSGSNSVGVSLRVLSSSWTTIEYPVGANPVYVESAKLSSDNYFDLVSANADDGSISVLINKGDGTGTFLPAVTYAACTDARAVVFGDFNGDTLVDIAVRCSASGRLAILINAGNGAFLPAVVYALGGTPRTINSSDFDGDGNLDVVLGLGSANAVAVLFGNGDGTFQAPILIPVGLDPGQSVQVRDVDGDSRSDITVPLRGESAVAVLRNGGTFAAGANIFIGGTSVGSGNASIAVQGGGSTCAFTHADFIPVAGGGASPPLPPPAALAFPQGLVDWGVAGCDAGATITITMSFPQYLPRGTRIWKYGPTPSNHDPHWYMIPATITANVVTFTITDGELGDDDLTVNGAIVDQVGPAVSPRASVPVPATTPIGVAALILAFVLLGAFLARRRTPCLQRTRRPPSRTETPS